MARSMVASVVIVGSGLLIGAVTAAASSSKPSTYTWPEEVHGQLVRSNSASSPKSLPFGKKLSAADLALSHTEDRWTSSFFAEVGYGLLYIQGYQYPVISKNRGLTWSIDGAYWETPSQFSQNGATVITTFSPTQAAAYGVKWLYTTGDGGQQWYVTKSLHNIEAVQLASNETWVDTPYPSYGFIADVDYTGGTHSQTGIVTSRAQYLTTDGGATWRLIPLR